MKNQKRSGARHHPEPRTEPKRQAWDPKYEDMTPKEIAQAKDVIQHPEKDKKGYEPSKLVSPEANQQAGRRM